MPVSLEAFTPLQVISGIRSAVGGVSNVLQQFNSANTDSLIKYTQPCRVEPMVLIDQSLQHDPAISDTLQVLSSIFTGYYLQAVSLMTTVNGISVIGKLDPLNPNRSPLLAANSVSREDYQFSLPSYASKNEALASNLVASVEAYATPASAPNTAKVASGPADKAQAVSESVKEAANLAVGKIVEVKFRDGNGEYVMPITIRLIPLMSTATLIKAILGSGAYQFNMKERWHKWRAGEISLIGDLIFCNDLIKRHRKLLNQDTHGFYAETMARRGRNVVSAVISGQPSVATASNMAVMSARTAVELERELGGKLNDFKVREDAMSATSLMLMVVLDPDYERVTIYSRSIPQPSSLAIRDLKTLNKGNGPDITEIMKALMDRSAPLR